MTYFVTEYDKKPDGTVSNSNTARASLASALNLYYQRASIAVMTDAFTQVVLTLQDEDGTVLKNELFQTQYVPPVPEEEEEEENGMD